MPDAAMLVSYFPNSLKPKLPEALPLPELLAGVRDGRWAEQVQAVRALDPASTDYTSAKRGLPSFTASGTFKQRSVAGLLQHSGFLCLDIDAKTNPGVDLAAARRRVEADSYTFACFASAGGLGWASVIPVPVDDHKGSFRALERYYQQEYGLTVDPACSDVSRLRFVSHDPSLYLNEEADTFEESEPEPAKPATTVPARARPARTTPYNEDYGQRALELACDRVRSAADGTKRTVLNTMAFLCGGYIGAGFLGEAEAQRALEATISSREVEDLPAAFKTITIALRDGQQKPVLPPSLQRIVRQQQRNEVPREAIVQSLSASTGAAAEALAAGVDSVLAEPNPTLLTFWSVNMKEGKNDYPTTYKLRIERYELREWLRGQGFSFRPAGAGGAVEFLHSAQNIVRLVERYELKQHVLGYVEQLPPRFDNIERADLLEAVLVQIRGLFDKEALDCLPPLVGEFLRDTASTARYFFRNCWVEVTADAIALRPYDELPGLIWQSQVRPHDFREIFQLEAMSCHFHRFLVNITGGDPQRLAQLQRALGYLLHGYKNDASARVVIFVDQVATAGQPAGGTGKSLLIRAVGEMIKVTQLPGATFRFDDDFRFALIEDDTRIAYFDEWDGRRLPFKKLFTEITSDMVVNRKNKPQVVVPFERSPKFAITTNDMVGGQGASHERRRLEIALAPHYSDRFTPKDEFGQGFFNQGWDETDYLYFFNLALGWVQQYLAHGLMALDSHDIQARKMEQDTSPEFIEFAQAVLLLDGTAPYGNVLDDKLWATDLYQQFTEETGESRARFTLRIFMKWMERFGYTKVRNTVRGDRRNQFYFLKPQAQAE
ncbi:hypothetical protein MON38_10610 [Hymenobacter sp. DH14]|uniref:BT4734-like N-terminal domain-containing protein n=1 Tax=Hymenobacter cyanobacteriorum TaxID=2926463 RepID=A0A9X1VFM0_9BACT|nr:BT4734/BF3469 family protein [Hymenobacter cyanobacteriorum]MCI1187872.1 hypothetical protein [Hymenobacter cyanobacteriorum]